MFYFSSQKGFTLLELLLVLAIIAIIAAFTFPIYTGFQLSQIHDTRTEEIVQALRQAQSKSMAGQNDSSWGVYFDSSNNKFVIFQGTSYASRVSDYDYETELESTLSLSNISINGGGSEVVFTKIDGSTTDYGSLDLTTDEDTATISINAAGLVEVD